MPSALRMTGAIRPLNCEVDGDAEVHVAVHDQRLALDARVHVRILVHDVAERARDERQVREREALLGLPLGLVRAPHPLDALVVDAYRRVDVRARRERSHHVLGRAASDVVERHDLVARGARRGGCRGGRSRGSCAGADGAGRCGLRTAGARRFEHVVARDPTAFAACRGSCDGSRPSSVMSWRTSGDVTAPPPPLAGASAATGTGAGGAGARERGGRGAAGAGAGAARARAAAGAARARPPVPARARPPVPVRSRCGLVRDHREAHADGTVSPSGTTISVR